MATSTYGRRLLPVLVDELAATEPDRVFISVPYSKNVEDGFHDIDFRAFARAVNRCSWWIRETFGEPMSTFPTISYFGPHDARYLMLILACNKVGYKVSRTASTCGV